MPHRVPPVDPADPAAHAAHDAGLVAAYAAGDATGAELEAATTLVAACGGCAALHRDLRAIAAALPATPAPRRTRDFRLTPEQAASLRPAGWRRVLAPFAGTRFAFAAPLGSGLAALGIVGILLAGPGLSMGGATAQDAAAPAEAPLLAAPVATDDGSVSMTAGSAEPAPEVQGPVTAPEDYAGAGTTSGGADKNASASGGASTPDEAAAASGEAARVMGDRESTVPMPGNLIILAVALGMVDVGGAMVGLRVLSRRVA